ncbi:MAG: hypothetical protein ABSG96_24725 [Terracidiphilus sp.]|jgi:hypothetical protein
MEADWEFEVGGEGPVIEALWPGFVDLRLNPELADQLTETVGFRALSDALVRLNAEASPIWTSKCGVWKLSNPDRSDPDRFDPDELDAPKGGTVHTKGCYIDLLPKCTEQWPSPDMIADSCKAWCKLFRAVPQRCCRVDLIIRRAFIHSGQFDLGVTAYLTACGKTETEANAALQQAMGSFADVLSGRSTLQ